MSFLDQGSRVAQTQFWRFSVTVFMNIRLFLRQVFQCGIKSRWSALLAPSWQVTAYYCTVEISEM